MIEKLLFVPILFPILCGLLSLLYRKLPAVIAVAATTINLILAIAMFGREGAITVPWAGGAIEFSLRLYHFSGFIMLAASAFAFLVALYSFSFMKERAHAKQFFAYFLITAGMVNGAVLADNLIVLLFFWEGLLATQFGMIAIGRQGAFRTATKAFIILGVTDLCMMLGIALTGWLARSAGEAHYLNMSAIAKLNLAATGWGGLAMMLLMIGAISKAGSMPFHSWIPDAAVDAPLPFMAILPASMEKLLGIYFLARITLDLYHMVGHSWMSLVMMIVGAVTILLAVMMALVQKDYKRLLSYHAISQVGYMILGVGTALPIGIVGGLFHMINNALYKSCLFLTGGAVEKQAGTTDLSKLGGIGRKMPVTFACFVVTAVAISGVPPLNGFFSKELIYDAAKERNIIFYFAALLGTFFTAASFLKLGHSAYLGQVRQENRGVREAPLPMLIPMIVIAAICVLFGLYNALPLDYLIQPVIADRMEGASFAGLLPRDWFLAAMTVVVLCGALLNHLVGAKINGGALEAVDHIHYAPVLKTVYEKAEKRWFDPYDIGRHVMWLISRIGWWADRGIDWLYDRAVVFLSLSSSSLIRKAHNGSFATYVLWSLIAAAAAILFLNFPRLMK